MPRYPLSVTFVQTVGPSRPVVVLADSLGLHVSSTFATPVPCMLFSGYVEGVRPVLTVTIEQAIAPTICQQFPSAFNLTGSATGIPSGSYKVRVRVADLDVTPIIYQLVDSATVVVP